jgi:hypothetical protein
LKIDIREVSERTKLQITFEPETIKEVSLLFRIARGIKAPNRGFGSFRNDGWAYIEIPLKKNANYSIDNS